MIFQQKSNASDAAIARTFSDFVPDEVFDIHVHTYDSAHFQKEISFLRGIHKLGCEDHRDYLTRYMPVKKLHGLYFGIPEKQIGRAHV